jgi:dienelactone hydrolase
MPRQPRPGRTSGWPTLVACLILANLGDVDADVITLKSGQTLTGLVDRDGTTVQVFDDDGLKRTILRESKIEKTEPGGSTKGERFQLVQPLTVHAGEMPKVVIGVEAGPWDALGRRKFRFRTSATGKPIEMTQAINELSPRAVRARGIDGFWTGPLDIRNVPREVVVNLLSKVDQKNQNERLRVGRFLIQAEWFPEARAELDRLAADFPELKETVETVKKLVVENEARQLLAEVEQRRGAGQPREVLARLKGFPLDGAPADVLSTVRNLLRDVEAEAAEAESLGDSIRKAADALPAEARKAAGGRLLEILRDLAEAPDAVRGRVEPALKAGGSLGAEARFALVLSGWVVGAERAVPDLREAEALWSARDLVRAYLAEADDSDRSAILGRLKEVRLPGDDGGAERPIELPTLTAIARLMKPPLDAEQAIRPGEVKVLRVRDDPNPSQPTEYATLLPPEYHPLRSYPAVVVLHGEETPSESLAWLAEEAGRRGYILIAPEYGLRDRKRAYRFTPSEHAAVELALRDARRRFAIDADRVYLVGQVEGGHMAWDLALSHPDEFAGVMTLSGLPAKYCWAYQGNAALIPFYIVEGDLAPAEREIAFEQWAKPQITRNRDILYTQYFRRGLEPFPEEAPNLFAWMAGRRRDPSPKEFEVASARECDVRFFGVVIRDFARGRSVAPEVADPLGRGIRPAKVQFRANAVLNKLVVDTNGVTRLDVWVGPDQVDFSKRVEIQINGKSYFKDVPKLTDYEPFLEDLRIRGDRQQVFWMRVAAPAANSNRF